MTPNLRRLHWLNIGVQLVGVAFFASAGLWFYLLWAAVFGAISSAALYGESVRD